MNFPAKITENVTVQRHNGQNPYGAWMPIADAPEWVADMIGDEIAENDAESGQVERAGSIWGWHKAR